MRVSELMSRDVVTIEPGASCHEAIERMVRQRLRHLPVVAGDGTVAGVITDRDVRHHLFQPTVFAKLGSVNVASLLNGVAVSEIMSWPAMSIDAEADITEAAAVMRRSKVGSLLVMAGARLAGILTETDLLREIVRVDGCCCPEVETIVVSYP